jgi:rhodanese-related sulfurtransferase
MKTISPQELHKRMEAGLPAALIDVRTPAEFGAVHATGARNAPLESLRPEEFAKQLDEDGRQPVYVICQSGARSAQACEKLTAAGVGEVHNVEGGTTAWVAAGLPAERGRKALPLERQVRIVAGFMVVAGTALGWRVNEYFYLLPAFVGAGLMVAGITGRCGMAMLLAVMPWNQRA